jgi:hypothetical protein
MTNLADIRKARWSDEDGNCWGLGHQDKSGFSAWARRDAVEGSGLTAEEAEDYYSEAEVFHAYYRCVDKYGELMKITTTRRNAAHYPITGVWA